MIKAGEVIYSPAFTMIYIAIAFSKGFGFENLANEISFHACGGLPMTDFCDIPAPLNFFFNRSNHRHIDLRF